MAKHRLSDSQPPDGGWGWVVLAAAFFNSVITQGLLKSGGVIYNAFPNVVPMTKPQAAIMATITEAIMRFMGPISGSLAQRFSYRSVVFIGGLLAGGGLVASSFATNYFLVLITFGVMYGVGAGLILVPGDIITGLYFDKYRAMAMGLEFAGGPLGAVFIAPCMDLLIGEYGLRGALLIYGGMLFNTCAVSLVYRTGSWFSERERALSLPKVDSSATILTNLEDDQEADYEFKKEPVYYIQYPELENKTPNSYDSQTKFIFPEDPSLDVESIPENHHPKKSCFQRIRSSRLSFFLELRYWLVNLSNFCMVMGFPMVLTMMPDYTVKEVSPTTSTQQAAFILSVFNLSDLAGRISYGLLADRNLFKRKHGFMATLVLSGIVIAFFPSLSSYGGVMGCTVVYGIILGAASICPSVILNDAVGVIRFPVAYGTIITFSSLASFSSGPILGVILEETGSYKPCFYVLCAVLIAGGCVWLLEPINRIYKNRGQETSNLNKKNEMTRF